MKLEKRRMRKRWHRQQSEKDICSYDNWVSFSWRRKSSLSKKEASLPIRYGVAYHLARPRKRQKELSQSQPCAYGRSPSLLPSVPCIFLVCSRENKGAKKRSKRAQVRPFKSYSRFSKPLTGRARHHRTTSLLVSAVPKTSAQKQKKSGYRGGLKLRHISTGLELWRPGQCLNRADGAQRLTQ